MIQNIKIYKKPEFITHNYLDIHEIMGTTQTQYTGNLIIYGVKSAMYSPSDTTKDTANMIKVVKLNNESEITNKIV